MIAKDVDSARAIRRVIPLSGGMNVSWLKKSSLYPLKNRNKDEITLKK
jgi:hypothetical protein